MGRTFVCTRTKELLDMPPNSSPSLATVERPVIAARGGVVARGGVAGLITVAATVVALVPAMVVSPPPAAAQQQVTQTTSARCNGRAESNFAWQQDNSDRLCTLLAGGTCSAGTQGCTVAVNANMSATAADPHLLTAIHAWVGVVF
ncbi:MAG TPA: hypothetical protein VME46_24255, partial [Acidimicrobiales bacterium]|nr:hypothetical protein [Acidimicrobiales bacterium]